MIDELDALLSASARGRIIRDGATVVIAGRPNVGKSSLFNALLGHARAIVTETAGTTRDLITETCDVEGLRVTLVDTAGVRDTSDRIELEGVWRGTRAREVAELIVVVLDGAEALTLDDARLLTETANRPRVIVANKSDQPRSVASQEDARPRLGYVGRRARQVASDDRLRALRRRSRFAIRRRFPTRVTPRCLNARARISLRRERQQSEKACRRSSCSRICTRHARSWARLLDHTPARTCCGTSSSGSASASSHARREDSMTFDVIVVGAGHAGVEAAYAAARMGCHVGLCTLSLETVAHMPCNPAIGGTAKGHLVREIDALGGLMGRAIDATGIQFKLLNRSRGPAVWSPRAQADKRPLSPWVTTELGDRPNIEWIFQKAGQHSHRGWSRHRALDGGRRHHYVRRRSSSRPAHSSTD